MTEKHPETPEQIPQTDLPNVVRRRPAPEQAPEQASAAAEPQAQATEAAPAITPEEAQAHQRRQTIDVSAPPKPAPKTAPAPSSARASGPDNLDDEFSAMMSAAFSGPSKPRSSELVEGQQIVGKVVHIGEDNVFVDVGSKNEGFLARREVELDGVLQVAVGQQIEVFVVGFGASGVELTRALSRSSDAEASLRLACEGGIPVEGKVASRNKGGFEVTVMGERAFCPISQIEMDFTEDGDVHLGKTYLFLITKVEAKGKHLDVVISRAELERRERRAKQDVTFATLEVGQIRQGVVRKIMPFGVFVDLGGVDGLAHISELSWDRVEDAGAVYKPGDAIKVKVIGLKDMELGPDKARVSLSVKETQGDPWGDFTKDHEVGGTYEAEVVRLESFGAFVQIAPGVDGLIHISELSLSRVRHPSDVVKVGQQIRVQILGLDSGRKRVSLSMKSLHGDPWESAHERYVEGVEVEGTVEKVEPFGVFVSLEPGITALIPQSELNTERGRDPNMDFRQGQQVKAWVLTLDQVRQRLSLTRRDPSEARREPDEERAPRQETRRDEGGGRRDNKPRRAPEPVQWRDEPARGTGLGTFADLFPKKMIRKDKD